MAGCTQWNEATPSPTEGYREAIVLPEINADHFEIKTNLLQLVQANPFYGRESENPHAHINSFKRITSTLRFRNVPNDVIKESVSKTDERIDKLADQLSTLVEIVSKKVVTPAPVKAVEETCVTCGGAHSWYNCPTTDNNQASVCAATGSYNQVNPPNRVSNQMAPPVSTSGTLPWNTIPNPKGEMKEITTRSGVAYEGPSIPTNPFPKKVVERETEEITDKEQSNFQKSTAQIPPPVIPISILEPDVPKTLPKTTPILEPDVSKSLPKPNIPYPSRLNKEKFHALFLMPRFALMIRNFLMNKEKLLELAKVPLNENCSAMLLKKLPKKLGYPGKFLIPCNFPRMDVCHALADLGASINVMPLSFWKKLSLPELTPTQMTLELADQSITHPKGLAKDVYIKVGKFYFPTDFVVVNFEEDPRDFLILRVAIPPRRLSRLLPEKLLNNDPFQLPPMDLKQSEVTEAKSSIEEPPELELKDLPSHLEYAFLEENDKLPVIIAKGLKNNEKEALLKVIKKEVLKLLDAGMIYPISDSPWVSPVHCVPKKGGITVVAWKRISDKRTKNQAKNDKTEHGMEKREEAKVKSKPKSKKAKVNKSQPNGQLRKVKVNTEALNEEMLNGPTRTHLMGRDLVKSACICDFGLALLSHNHLAV
ncbi:reverse transcriptase domain-containing protein [Tanacetum coccineum]